MNGNTLYFSSPSSSTRTLETFFWNTLPVFLILVGAMLVAVQLRLKIFIGAALGDSYVAQPPLIYLALLAAAVVGSSFKQFRLPIAVAAAAGLIAVFMPDISQLQLLYFVITALLIGVIIFVWTPHHTYTGQPITPSQHLAQLWKHRVLLNIWVRYNVISRYSQTWLGIMWIVLLPLSTSAILAFVFSQILRSVDVGDVPFLAFFLSALTWWTLFSQGISHSVGSLLGQMGLINQVYFPREILVLVKLGEALVDLCFMFVAMLLFNALVGVFPNLNFIYLPLLLAIQLLITLGAMFFLSYLTVMVRDVPQLVGVGLQLLFYMTPIIFPVPAIPEHLRWVVIINPLASLIDAYRAVIVYNRPPDLVTLYYPLVVGCILLYTGYMFFKSNEKRLADFK